MRIHRTAGGPPALGLLVAVLVLLLSAAACTGDDPDADDPDGPGDPTSSWSPTGTMDPSSSGSGEPVDPVGPVEPELPEVAREASEEGARAFIAYYWELINYAQVTGDVKALRRASARSCDGCQAGIRGIRRHYAAGGSIVGGMHRVDRATLTEVTSASGIYAFQGEARVEHDAQSIISSDGTEEDRQPGSDEWDLYVLWVDGTRWRLDVMEVK
jgi:hypothetical protein